MLLCLALAGSLLLPLSPQPGNVDRGVPFILGLDLAGVNIARLAEAINKSPCKYYLLFCSLNGPAFGCCSVLFCFIQTYSFPKILFELCT